MDGHGHVRTRPRNQASFRQQLDALKAHKDMNGGIVLPGTPPMRFLSTTRALYKCGKLSVERQSTMSELLGPHWAMQHRRILAGERLHREWRAFLAGGHAMPTKRFLMTISDVRRKFTSRGAAYEMAIRRQIYGLGFPTDLLAKECQAVLWFRVYLMLKEGKTCRYRFQADSKHHATLRYLSEHYRNIFRPLAPSYLRLLYRARFPMRLLCADRYRQEPRLADNLYAP